MEQLEIAANSFENKKATVASFTAIAQFVLDNSFSPYCVEREVMNANVEYNFAKGKCKSKITKESNIRLILGTKFVPISEFRKYQRYWAAASPSWRDHNLT